MFIVDWFLKIENKMKIQNMYTTNNNNATTQLTPTTQQRNNNTMYKYAVVFWYNYRKELHAGFLKGFNDFDIAKRYALQKAEQDLIDFEENDEGVITEDEITDNNGPGKSGSPYKSIIGYGGTNHTGYATAFYCVVEWFDGVTNKWDEFKDDEYWEEKYGGQWYPKYSLNYN